MIEKVSKVVVGRNRKEGEGKREREKGRERGGEKERVSINYLSQDTS